MRAVALIYSVAFFTMAITVNAQNIRGAEIAVKDVIGKTIYLRLFYLMETPEVRTPIIDWGDGNSSTLEYMGIGYFEDVGLYRVQYGTHYVYADTSGMFELLFQDSFLIPGVRNIDHSETRTFAIRDSIFIFPEENVLQVNIFNPTAGRRNFEINSDGTLSHQLIRLPDLLGLGWDIHSYIYEIVPFPAEGFLDTIPSEDLYIENDMLYWDKPKAPGIYALGVKMTQKGEDYSGVTDSITLSTTTMGLMFEIDEEMIVSQYEIESSAQRLTIFPNPANDLLTISLPKDVKPHQREAHIYDMAGKLVMAKVLDHFETEVSIDNLPSGLYQVRVEEFVGRFIKI